MKSYSDIITQDTFFVIFPSGSLSQEDFTEFCELAESVKIFEFAYMSCIICKYLVKEEVTILESAGMYGQYQATFLIALVRRNKFCCSSDAGDYYVSTGNKFTMVGHSLKVNLIIFLTNRRCSQL